MGVFSRKNSEYFIVIAIVLSCLVLLFVYFSKPKPVTNYEWTGLKIEIKSAGKADAEPAAIWGPATVSRQDIWLRAPHLKERQVKADDLEQLIYDSDYYFNFLNISVELLIEKLKSSYSLEVSASEHEKKDFKIWLDEHGINPKYLTPQSIQVMKLDLKDKFQKTALKKMLIPKISEPVQIFMEPPTKSISWPQVGVIKLGNSGSKNSGLFICDMMSPICFESLSILKKLTKDLNVLVNYRPGSLTEDIYGDLRALVGLCVSDLEPERFWNYVEALKKLPRQTEEPELLRLSGSDSKAMRACLVSSNLQKEWESHKQFLLTLGKPAIPVLVLGGEPILGPFSYERASEAVARRSAKKATSLNTLFSVIFKKVSGD